MSSLVERSQELQSPEYWDGIDIRNSESFPFGPGLQDNISPREQHLATIALRSCLEAVMRGTYTERSNESLSEFNPGKAEFTDGTVVVIDEEKLIRLSRQQPNKTETPFFEKPLPVDPPYEYLSTPISQPYARFWKANQAQPETWTAVESAMLAENISYSRVLMWGVLFTRRSGTRMLGTYFLAGAKTHENGIAITQNTNLAVPLPLLTRRAVAHPAQRVDYADGERPVIIRQISRVQELAVVQPYEESDEERPSLFEQGKKTVVAIKALFQP